MHQPFYDHLIAKGLSPVTATVYASNVARILRVSSAETPVEVTPEALEAALSTCSARSRIPVLSAWRAFVLFCDPTPAPDESEKEAPPELPPQVAAALHALLRPRIVHSPPWALPMLHELFWGDLDWGPLARPHGRVEVPLRKTFTLDGPAVAVLFDHAFPDAVFVDTRVFVPLEPGGALRAPRDVLAHAVGSVDNGVTPPMSRRVNPGQEARVQEHSFLPPPLEEE